MSINKLSGFSVVVSTGSGCLFQPMADEYSYILTAKHCVQGISEILVQRHFIDESTSLPTSAAIRVIEAPYLHQDEHKDAAIIKIEKIDGLDHLVRTDAPFNASDKYYLTGHPLARREADFTFRANELSILNNKGNGYIECELNKPALYSEIAGHSGGGIIRINNGFFSLAGIQKGMSAFDDKESLGRIDIMPLSFYDEIIQQNEVNLAPLVQPYLKSFLWLVDNIFPLRNLAFNKDILTKVLKEIASDLCNEFTPEEVITLYGDSILISGQQKEIINNKLLWISFLEILVINQLYKNEKITFDQLKELHKKRKLLFGVASNWIELTEDILRSDLSDIEKGGIVIINVEGDTEPSFVELSGEIVSNICSVPVKEMNISNTVRNPIEDLSIVHIYKFQDFLIRNPMLLKNENYYTILDKLKNATRNII
ncbi:ABC-three component system protein [Chitinophaga sp. 30R24]|uniref:ABC-three component system protein n=1 Tax=Chitinophaga sp. 30R24 TaxID=3248838 RepID=UPI003B8F36A7